MPQLDLRDALLEPLTIDYFQVIRKAQNVTIEGRATAKSTYFNTFGVVDAASDNDLARLADMEYQGSGISIVTQFKLRGVSKQANQNYSPDIIQWASNYYTVVTVEDYSRYGAGWIQAIAAETNYVGEAPGQNGFIPSLTFNDLRNSGLLACFL